jgi:hypothetical protein
MPAKPAIEAYLNFVADRLDPRRVISFNIAVVARQAGHLTVFQRSPAYTLPWQVRPLEPGELGEMKSRYDEIRAGALPRPVPDAHGTGGFDHRRH